MTKRVVQLTVDDVTWSFNDAVARIRNTVVSGFPAYSHDIKLVGKTLREVEKCVKLRHKPTIYLLCSEAIGRTNGWSARGYGSYDEDKKRYTMAPGSIELSGKVIPPHPAVTRYLVAHEYGHQVDYEMCELRDVADNGLDEEYAELRNLPSGYREYGGGRWHSNVGEVLANDFRIIVTEIETEYWPHKCARPEKVKGLHQWWENNLPQ